MTSHGTLPELLSGLKHEVLLPLFLWERRERLRGVSEQVEKARQSSLGEGEKLSPDTIAILDNLEKTCKAIEAELGKKVPAATTVKSLTTEATEHLTVGLISSALERSKTLLQERASALRPESNDISAPALDRKSLANVVSSWLYFEASETPEQACNYVYNPPPKLAHWSKETSQTLSGPDSSSNWRRLLLSVSTVLDDLKTRRKDPSETAHQFRRIMNASAEVLSLADLVGEQSSTSLAGHS